ncbi:unnamed protein product, partial [Cuscuta campestris]
MANNNPFNLRYVLEKEKLSGTNFLDWEMNLKIVLECEKKLYVLTSEPPKAPEANARAAEITLYRKYEDDACDVRCLMLATMTPELQRLHKDMEAHPMMTRLKGLYQDDRSDRNSKLDAPLHPMLATDLILGSLPAEYSQTVVNFYMNKLEMTMPELLKFLTTAEESLGKGKGKSVLMVEGSTVAKKSGPRSPAGTKRKGSKKPKPASNSSSLKPKEGAKKKSAVCYYCGKKGHWRRNCAKLLAERKEGKKPQTSGIFVIEVNMSDITSWVMDTGCGSHICTSMQDLHERRQLTEGEIQLKVGNGALVNALAIGTYSLSLPSGLVLQLNNCLFVPSMSRNIISVSCLDKAGFSFVVKDKTLFVFRNDIFYASAKMTNGLYVLDMDTAVYNVDVKRNKPNSLNLAYLWHCRLGHINEKRISKLHRSGVLDSFDFQSYD